MIALGYMAKRIVERPDWLGAPAVRDIYAVSACISPDFADYITFWAHNGFWFFDRPSHITRLCARHGISLDDLSFVYYEAHPQQFDIDNHTWRDFGPDPDIKTDVLPVTASTLLGYDIVCYSMQNSPEHSPLSCNHVATDVQVNPHCLIDSLDYAIQCLDTGIFDNAEPGPMRIVAVHSLRAGVEGGTMTCTGARLAALFAVENRLSVPRDV